MPAEGHRARKRFGQNFLHDPAIINRLVDAIQPGKNEHFVEIGPGLGALTFQLVDRVAQLDLIEVDRDLVANLRQQLADSGRDVHIHQADALNFDYAALGQHELRIIGNLPYNISTPLLFHLLSFSPLVSDMTFMLQKEVVDRICAEPDTKQYGRLSVMLQQACEVQALFRVSPGAFKPVPKVQSAVIRIIPKKQPQPPLHSRHSFEIVVRDAFSQRRKTIRNSLRNIFEPEQITCVGIALDQRAENLSVEDFVKLANLHHSIKNKQL